MAVATCASGRCWSRHEPVSTATPVVRHLARWFTLVHLRLPFLVPLGAVTPATTDDTLRPPSGGGKQVSNHDVYISISAYEARGIGLGNRESGVDAQHAAMRLPIPGARNPVPGGCSGMPECRECCKSTAAPGTRYPLPGTRYPVPGSVMTLSLRQGVQIHAAHEDLGTLRLDHDLAPGEARPRADVHTWPLTMLVIRSGSTTTSRRVHSRPWPSTSATPRNPIGALPRSTSRPDQLIRCPPVNTRGVPLGS